MSDSITTLSEGFATDDPRLDVGSLKQIVDTFDAGIMLADTSGKLLLSNALATRLVGAEVSGAAPAMAEAWGPDHGFFFPDQATPMPLEDMPMAQALRGKPVHDVTMFLRNPSVPDGVFVDVSAWPLTDRSGRRWGALALFRDVTERYTTAAALSKAYDAGRLEILDTVLHNVGNAMSSVVTGLGTIEELARSNRPLRHLRALGEALRTHEDDLANYLRDDPQGRKVVPFIAALAEDFAALGERLTKAQARAARNAEYIVEVIRKQQRLE